MIHPRAKVGMDELVCQARSALLHKVRKQILRGANNGNELKWERGSQRGPSGVISDSRSCS